MATYEHLPLPVYRGDVQRQSRRGGGGYKSPADRRRDAFSHETNESVDAIASSFQSIKQKFAGHISPSLIYEIEINQSVNHDSFEQTLSSMGVFVLSVAENKKGYWVVFSDDDTLSEFRRKLTTYGSPEGAKYDFFDAIDSLRDIPREEKIGPRLQEKMLGDTPDFIDIELWRMGDQQVNETFINELKQAYADAAEFRITDTLTTKSFVLLRVKLTASIFDEIIELKEIARADRPARPAFNPFEYSNIDVSNLSLTSPDENAAGILVIDSGIISNHPLLEKCIGGEENFQNGEPATHDTVGHGTAVAGCAAYGDIEQCIEKNKFTPSNWLFSAKVMYAEQMGFGDGIRAAYDPEKLVEHQLKEAIESFVSNPEYHIRVVNISLGNSTEVWHKHYRRQLPLAALIDELAQSYPFVSFIVSAGNKSPQDVYDSVGEVVDNYPRYLLDHTDFKLVNPATAALALTVGSVAPPLREQVATYGDEQIKTPIADSPGKPSPFSRTGPGINGMIKPELSEFGGNTILFSNHGRVIEDVGGKMAVLSNQTTDRLVRFDAGTSFAAPKVARTAGQIANEFPQRSANFINNMLLVGAQHSFVPGKAFYGSTDNDKALESHLCVSGYGVPVFERAIRSFDNRVVLFDEGQIELNQIKVFALQIPDIFFTEKGRKKITTVLTFNPETRSSRGDSYLGNTMEMHLFHSVSPEALVEKYGVLSEASATLGVPEELKKFEITMQPGSAMRKKGCHQKAWKEYKKEPKSRPSAPLSLVLLNFNKWIGNNAYKQDYCISVIFEHEKEIELYAEIRATVQVRARVR